MNFKNWLVLTESKEEKALALELAGDQNTLNELQKVIKPKDKNTIDKLLVLAAYYYSEEKDLERIKKDIQDYIELLNNNTMKLITVDPATKQPSMEYGNLVNTIHGHQGEAAAKDRKNFQVTDQDFQGEEPIDTSPDGTIKVYKANSPQQCIILGKGHSFCISQPGNTMWQSYRDSKHSTFYFVKDSSRNDRLSTVVVDMTKNGPELTDVVNTTGTTLDPYTGEPTNETDPYFKYLKEKGINISKIEHIGQTPEEQKENEKLGRINQDLNWFVNLSHTEKSKYIGRGHLLTDEQFDYLWENGFKSLLEQYAKTGRQLLDYQIDKIATNSDLRSNYAHNRFLANDHTEDMNGKEFDLLNQKQKEHVLNNTENIQKIISTSKNRDETAKFIIQNKKDLTDKNVYALLSYATNKDEMANLIIQNKKDLTDDDVYNLLNYAKNKDEMAKLLGSENINKLTDENVRNLLNYAKNKDEMANLIIQNKKDLTDKNVYALLSYAKNKDEMAKLLGSENINKLTDENVRNLLNYAKNKDEIANLIIQNKKDLTDKNVYTLLNYATNKDEIVKLLGSENINKLTDENVSYLLSYATNKDEMANLIIQNKKDLTDDDVSYLLNYAKNKDETAKLIIQNKKDLTDKNVYTLLNYATNKDEMAKLLGSENINKLSNNDVSYLLNNATNKDEMAKLIIQYKDLTDENVRGLLNFATNKDEIAQLLGSENINKLTDNDVSYLLHYATNKDGNRRILQKYGRIQ
jgi:hypothetical protein